MSFLTLFHNLDLLSVGLVCAAIGILGFLVFYSNPKSITNKSFLLFSVITIIYGILNYLNYQVSSPILLLWLFRMVIFIAVWHAFSLFQFLYVFPEQDFNFSKTYKFVLFPLATFTAFFNLTSWVFSGINTLSAAGQVSKTTVQPGIYLFIILIFCLIIGAIYSLVKKTRAASGVNKTQYRIILSGTVITFALLATFNMVLPALFLNVRFIPLAPVFIFPFIVFTTYAILKHHLLNIKIIATEILAFALAVASLFEIILSTSLQTALLRFLVFLLILVIVILLDRSVRNEVQQREQLQILTTRLEDANEKLKALDQARAEFITIASHQLRTPPATVKWYLGATLSGDYGPVSPEVRTMLEKTQRTNNSLITLIEDLLNVSRIERGKMEFLFEPVDLLELANITFEQLSPIAEEKHLQMVFKRPEQPLPKIMADREKIRQVMNNLIDNALKYTKQGTVTVSLFQEGDNLRFQVSDSGKGITAEEQASIFEKYSRGKESIKQSAGLGLGLYVAKVIVGQHKGKIWAKSAGLNQGSAFIFTVPIHNDLSATTLLDLADKPKG